MENGNNNVSELEQLRAQVKDLERQLKDEKSSKTYWFDKYYELKELHNKEVTAIKFVVDKLGFAS